MTVHVHNLYIACVDAISNMTVSIMSKVQRLRGLDSADKTLVDRLAVQSQW